VRRQKQYKECSVERRHRYPFDERHT
jgi:hypothetical protein